jgi:predicted NBD/HSP70 family sugar kinase
MTNSPLDSRNAGLRNERLIIRLLKEHGRLSQSQLCSLAGLSSSTASYIVGRLREKNLILETRGQSKKRGAKPVYIKINPLGRFAVGAEINPSMIVTGLFDFNGELLDSVRVLLDSDHSVDHVLQLLEINLKGLLSKHNVEHEKVIGAGITLSGSISPEGTVELSSPLGWKKVPLKKFLSARLDFPVRLYTTRVRLLAEVSSEPPLSADNILYLNVGSGVGSTIIIDGNLIHGAGNRCGEIGHIVVDPDGPLCGCGQKGCLEALISGPALAKKIKTDIANGTETTLAETLSDDDVPEEVVKKWTQALQSGDNYSKSLLEFVADHLSRSAAAAINAFDPQVLILAGYVTMQKFDYFAERIKKQFTTDVYDDTARSIEIIKARAGEDALIRGAGIAVLQDSDLA